MRTSRSGARPQSRRRAGTVVLALACAAIPLSLLLSCYPGEITDIDELDIVGTLYDPNVVFSSYSTFVLPDSVDVIDERNNPGNDPPLTPAFEQQILNTVVTRMTDLGYTRVTTVTGADVGMAVGIILTDETYVASGYPGWGYCGWYPGWPCWGYYPPVVATYSYDSGTVLIDMHDFSTAATDTAAVVWQAALNGLASSSTQSNQNRIIQGIHQAFDQSPYLAAGGP